MVTGDLDNDGSIDIVSPGYITIGGELFHVLFAWDNKGK